MSSLTVIPPQVTIMDIAVRVLDGLYSLNDLHRASGENPKHKPANFMRVANTKDLIAEIEQCSDMSNGIKSTAYKIVRGGKIERVGTWVCKDLVYSYAMWISPKFALLVIRTFDKLVTGELKIQPDLATISTAQQHSIRKAVSKKCKSVSTHYQTVYNKLYEHFGIPRYTELLAIDFEDAIRFISTVEFSDQNDNNEFWRYVGVIKYQELTQVLAHARDVADMLSKAISDAQNHTGLIFDAFDGQHRTSGLGKDGHLDAYAKAQAFIERQDALKRNLQIR